MPCRSLGNLATRVPHSTFNWVMWEGTGSRTPTEWLGFVSHGHTGLFSHIPSNKYASVHLSVILWTGYIQQNVNWEESFSFQMCLFFPVMLCSFKYILFQLRVLNGSIGLFFYTGYLFLHRLSALDKYKREWRCIMGLSIQYMSNCVFTHSHSEVTCFQGDLIVQGTEVNWYPTLSS